ncbi:hypothetical protein, partial [Escherichia coli]|uniref:hypothetical protein n=1 Tax=Escherichia coli TaxID=562 RepID=UPI003BA291A5
MGHWLNAAIALTGAAMVHAIRFARGCLARAAHKLRGSAAGTPPLPVALAAFMPPSGLDAPAARPAPAATP